MKTETELIEALRVVADEASKSGFNFCAALSSPAPRPCTTIICGEPLKLFGMTEVIKLHVNAMNPTFKNHDQNF